MGKITIKKMSVPSKGGVTVSFERTMPGQEVPDAITYQSEAEPSEGFTDALAALVPEVIVIAELPDNQKKGMKIVGVTFSYSGESHKMGAAISVTKLLAGSDSPLSFTTPCKVSINAGEDVQQDKGKLTKDQEKKLNKLLKEIEKYIDGGKLQVNMFDKKEK